MYKVLLVDDEYLELEMLENHVPWYELGFDIIGSAKNGNAALKIIKNSSPNIIITDVKMPIMDGIKLSKQVHSLYPNIHIVFLSGYNDFPFLKAAVQIGAVDYLLKPLEINELITTLQNIKKKLDIFKQINDSKTQFTITLDYIKYIFSIINFSQWESHYQETAQLFADLLNEQDDNTIIDDYYTFLISVDEYSYLVNYLDNGEGIIANINNKIHLFSASLNIVLIQIDAQKYILISDSNIINQVRNWHKENENTNKWVTISYYLNSTKTQNIMKSYSEILTLRNLHVALNGPGSILEYPLVQKNQQNSVLYEQQEYPQTDELIRNILSGDSSQSTEWINNYFLYYINSASSTDLNHNLFEVLDNIYNKCIYPSKCIKDNFEDKSNLYKRILSVESITLLKTIIFEIIYKLINELTTVKEDRYQMMVKHICQYIEENYSHQLTIDSLAEKFYFSPNYLRALFKKHTGDTILKHLTAVRMKHAIDMLQDTSLKINDISQKIGYLNPSYFCAIFLKKYGVTPNQYRNKVTTK